MRSLALALMRGATERASAIKPLGQVSLPLLRFPPLRFFEATVLRRGLTGSTAVTVAFFGECLGLLRGLWVGQLDTDLVFLLVLAVRLLETDLEVIGVQDLLGRRRDLSLQLLGLRAFRLLRFLRRPLCGEFLLTEHE